MLIRIISLVVLTCTLAGSVQYQHNPTSEVSADEKITNMTTNGSEQEDSEIQTEPDISSEETKERNLLTDALNTVLDPNSVIVNNEINNRFKSILDGIANANQTLGEFMDNMDKLSLEVCERSQDRLWSYVNDINNEEKKNDMMTDAGHEDEIKKQYWNILKSKYLHDPAIQADLDLKRKFRIIQERATNLQMPQSKQREEIDRMQRVWSRATVCAYNSTCGPDDTRSMSGQLFPPVSHPGRYTFANIITIFKTTNQSKELIYYWKNFRDATGGKIRPIFKEYVNRINSIAKSENFTDAGAMWRFSFDDEDFTGTVNRLWGEVKPLYKLIHEYVKLKLKIYYKEEMNTKSDTIPAHLLGNLWAQEWQSIYPRVSPHPSHPHLALSGESMSSRRLFDAVNDFHQSLGFQSSADSYSSVDDSPPTGAGCLPSSHDMCDGLTYRIKWCGDSSTQPVTALSRAARLLGHVQYFRHYSSLPPLYRDGPTPAFHDAISEMVAVQMTSPQHLKRLGFTDSELSPELFLNHLLWVALEKVPLMAFAFVLDKWRWNVFANTTQAWNQHWVGETGVSAPVLRNESDLDPAAKYHVVSHVQYITYLISHVLEFQIMLALCNSANYTGPLHQCSLYGAREAGSILSKGMALGASKNWRTVLRTLTGESEISTKGVLEYFRPLQDYLIKENIQLAQLDAEDDMDARAPVIVGVILVTLTGVIVTMYLVKKKGLGPKISRALGIVQNGSLDIVSSEMSAGKMNEVTATVVTGGVSENKV